jgi:hypothetical protein
MASLVQNEWNAESWPAEAPPHASLTPETRMRPAQGFFLGMGLGLGIWLSLALMVWLVVL